MPYTMIDLYPTMYPLLPLQAALFFNLANARGAHGITPRTIADFINTFQGNPSGQLPQPGPVNTICERLVKAGCLSFAGTGPGRNVDGLENTYLSATQFTNADPNIVARTSPNLKRKFDHAAYGFPIIYNHCQTSVVPVVHTTRDDRQSVGTAFVIGGRRLVTARHCVEGAKKIAIRSVSPEALQGATWHGSVNLATDLC